MGPKSDPSLLLGLQIVPHSPVASSLAGLRSGWNEKGILVTMRSEVKKAAETWPKGLKEITGSEAEKYKL